MTTSLASAPASAPDALTKTLALAADAALHPLTHVLAIMLATGLLGGWAAYLIDAVSTGEGAEDLKRQTRKRYLVLGVIAAGVVPLFLSLAQSAIVTRIFKGATPLPFDDYFVFFGFCVIAAVSARSFIDTISQQVLRQAAQAKEAAAEAIRQSRVAEETAQIASELADDGGKNPAEPAATILDTAETAEAGETLPSLDAREHRALKSMMNVTFRTQTGIANDLGVTRAQVSDIIGSLAAKKLVERTVSPSTGGPRWRITRRGIGTLAAMDKRG